MYEKVLVTSTGRYLDEIVAHTLEFISKRETELIGIYVVETSAPFLTPKKVKEMMIEELRTKGQELLDKMEQKFQMPHIKFKKLLIEGDPADEIIKAAKKEYIDVIIMGSGKSKIDKELLGSVTEKVVHSTPCSVFLLRLKNEQ